MRTRYRHRNHISAHQPAHQLVEDVSLVHVDGDERLILGPLVSAQISGRHVDQLVQEVEELLIGRVHDLLATGSERERTGRRGQKSPSMLPVLSKSNAPSCQTC